MNEQRTVQGLSYRNTVSTKELAPLLLHVEPNLRTLHGALDRGKELGLFAGKVPGLVLRWNVARDQIVLSRRQACVLHLFGETRLLRFQHVGKEIVELGAVRHGQLAFLKHANETVAVFGFFRRPPPRAQIASVGVGIVRCGGRRGGGPYKTAVVVVAGLNRTSFVHHDAVGGETGNGGILAFLTPFVRDTRESGLFPCLINLFKGHGH